MVNAEVGGVKTQYKHNHVHTIHDVTYIICLIYFSLKHDLFINLTK